MRDEKKILSLVLFYFALNYTASLFFPAVTDANAHIIRAEYILENLTFPFAEMAYNQGRAYIYPPLFHVLLAGSKAIFGNWDFLPSFMAASSIYMTYKLVGVWYDKRTSLLAALSLSAFPFFFHHGMKAYTGTTVTFGFLLVFYSYFKYDETKKSKYLYLAYAFGGFLTSVKTYGPLATILISSHLLWKNKESLDDLNKLFLQIYKPVSIFLLLSLPWLIRNTIRVGNPFPKVLGGIFEYPTPTLETSSVLIPPTSEVLNFLSEFMGVNHTIIEALGRIHPALYFAWFLLPVSIVLILSYGAIEETDNSFVWMWVGSVVGIYYLGRILSSGTFSLKFRHFITISPALGLFATRAYQKFPVKNYIKKFIFGSLAVFVMIQMILASAEIAYATNTAYDPITEWIDENIPEDDIIYNDRKQRFLAQKTSKDFIFISRSTKPGYIHPDRNFTEELSSKADWAIIITEPGSEEEMARLSKAEKEGVVKKWEVIEAKRPLLWGDVGKVWTVYKVY
jgi:4-amino-4-deoxy-L-arabinose transferase-like glycosyltransferase